MIISMDSSVKVGLGSIAFAIFWMLAVFPAVPFLPIGRTAGSLLGAMLMVIFQVITPHEAYAAIDLPILGLLFGTMVVSIYLERADMFVYLGKLLSWKSRGSKDLLCRICLISAVSSALFTNDTTCVILTEFVLKIARQHNLPPHPFLLALASSANIGSSASPIGNPQNLVIAVQSKIAFSSFLFGVFPAMLVGAVVNALIIVCVYWKLLTDNDVSEENSNLEDVPDEEVISHRFSPATMSHYRSFSSKDWVPGFDQVSQIGEDSNSLVGGAPIQGLQGAYLRLPSEENEGYTKSWEHRLFWKSCVYLVAIGMLISLLIGLDMSWTALTAALALMVIDFKDATPCLEKVSYSLLIFFCGMFITVEGYNRTGVPSTFWDLTEPYAQIDHASGVVVLAVVILLLSNLASNVPTVLLLGGRVAASAASISASEERKAWLILAWVSTVAGNLSLLGSAANLIVCEQASRSKHFGYSLSFWTHLKFGFPSTLIVTAVGLLLIT